MNQPQTRIERRSFQSAELRKIRTEYKQSMNALRSKYFDYNAKKFRKTLFYCQYKQARKMNASVDSTVTCTYKEECTSPQTSTNMAPYNYECASQTEEDQTRAVSDHTDQAAVFEEEGVQADKLTLSDDLAHSVTSAHTIDIADEASSMTAFQSRSERRSVRRVELRQIRTNYKREMKGFCCHDYNAKKFKKTLFYHRLNQASIRRTEDTSVDCKYEETVETDTSEDISTGQIHAAVVIPATCTRQEEEGPSTQADTDMVFNNDECAPATESIHTAANREECDAENAPSSDSSTSTVMEDKEAAAVCKDVDIRKDAESFKMEWSILSLLSVSLFDGSFDTLGELQARDDLASSENTELGDKKQDTEDDLDDEVGEEEEEDDRPLVSAKEIDSSFYEKSLKETSWMLTPPSSMMSVICDEKTSSLLTPPQSINGVVLNKPVYVQPSLMGRVEKAAVVSVIQEATFYPIEGMKKKRLRTLKCFVYSIN
ncbi:hypothetical protein MFLAVUS_008415 [Mucor flavus]|uniref:Uncharacterized protein n=1 Tax=Mucor flavus TaxID=439312 RepID=A0ABP9Z705_9FUNG